MDIFVRKIFNNKKNNCMRFVHILLKLRIKRYAVLEKRTILMRVIGIIFGFM
jgi:hypothetical protein